MLNIEKYWENMDLKKEQEFLFTSWMSFILYTIVWLVSTPPEDSPSLSKMPLL